MDNAISLGEKIIEELDRHGVENVKLVAKENSAHVVSPDVHPDAVLVFCDTEASKLFDVDSPVRDIIANTSEALALPYPGNCILIFNL